MIDTKIAAAVVAAHIFEEIEEAEQLLPKKQTNKLRGLSPHANYTDRAAAACRRS